MRASYRATPTSPPVDCEIVGERVSGIVICRQVGRRLAGVWRARPDQLSPPVDIDVADFQAWLHRNLQQLGAV